LNPPSTGKEQLTSLQRSHGVVHASGPLACELH
jgi:hypothetical protein